MRGQELVKELLAFDAGTRSIVSLYLDGDIKVRSSELIRKEVRAMLLKAEAPADDIDQIEGYLDLSHDWSSRGLAVFCASGELFEAVPAAVPFRNSARIGNQPYVKPLIHYFEHFANYGVILASRAGGRYFAYDLGELIDEATFEGDEVRSIKRGGGSGRADGAGGMGQRGGQGGRHEDEVAARNLRATADGARKFFEGREIRRLFIGGTATNVAKLKANLTKKLQSCVAGTFVIDMNAGEREVSTIVIDLLRQVNLEREAALIDQLFDAAPDGDNATLGLSQTLSSINDGRVATLLVEEDYQASGLQDKESGLLLPDTLVAAAVSNRYRHLSDVVAVAINKTLKTGGQVSIVGPDSRLTNAGSIGALLRF